MTYSLKYELNQINAIPTTNEHATVILKAVDRQSFTLSSS